MREILLDRNYQKRKVTWEAVNSCSPRHTYLLPIFKKTLFKCRGGEAVLYSSSSSLLSMLAVQPAPVHPWKHQVKKATCHRGTSLQSQTGGPISPPRNWGPQSCYLLLLGQVLKELCRTKAATANAACPQKQWCLIHGAGWRTGKALCMGGHLFPRSRLGPVTEICTVSHNTHAHPSLGAESKPERLKSEPWMAKGNWTQERGKPFFLYTRP